jgi:2-polyprenyl-6-methoxyphenol hydroxylase-like FAD-dependent oxidoreductase
MTMRSADCDVLVAGAGLPGLAAARAIAQLDLSVVLVDRAGIGRPAPAIDAEDWDTRVYAISPGSAAFLRALGAWQRLSCDRVAPVESMRIEGDAAATCGSFSMLTASHPEPPEPFAVRTACWRSNSTNAACR